MILFISGSRLAAIGLDELCFSNETHPNPKRQRGISTFARLVLRPGNYIESELFVKNSETRGVAEIPVRLSVILK